MTDFETTLGEENSQTLTELVVNFETDFLKRQYPKLSTENAYKEFLTELRDEETKDWKKISEKSRTKFANSTLKDEIYRYPDSVWIESDTAKMTIKSPMPVVKSRFKYEDENGKVEYLESESSVPSMENYDLEFVVDQQKKSPEFNTIGKYIQALYQLKERDTFFSQFYKRKEYGFIRPEILASVLLEQNVDLNDYIVKRIIVLEIAY